MVLTESDNFIGERWGEEEVEEQPVGFWILSQLSKLGGAVGVDFDVEFREGVMKSEEQFAENVRYEELSWESGGAWASVVTSFVDGRLIRVAVCAGSGGAVVKSELRRKGKGQRLRIVKERLRLVPFVDR